MTYLALYFACLASIWWTLRVGWSEALKTILSVLIPSLLIIIFNAKAGRFLFRNPIVGFVSLLPTAIFIFKTSQPLVVSINSWIDRKTNDYDGIKDVVDAEVISKEDA